MKFISPILKLTASSRPSAPPSDSLKCLRFGHWRTLCTLNIYLLTCLLSVCLVDLHLELLAAWATAEQNFAEKPKFVANIFHRTCGRNGSLQM